MTLMKTGSCKHAVLVPSSNVLLTLLKPQAFPWTPSAMCILASAYLHGCQPQSSPCGLSLKPEPQLPAPTHQWGHANSFSAGKCLSATISAVNSLHFCLPSTCFSIPLRFWSFLLSSPMRGFPSVWKLFLLHVSLFEPLVSISNPLSLYFPISFALPHSVEISLLFWKSEVFASVQNVFCRSCSTFRCIFDVFVKRRWSPHLIPASYWKFPY